MRQHPLALLMLGAMLALSVACAPANAPATNPPATATQPPPTATDPPPTDTPMPTPTIESPVWSDEFNGPAGAAIDESKWSFDLGGGGWGNSELEKYTNSTQNVYQDGAGHLVIKAIEDPPGSYQYTSGRIHTRGKFQWQYGRLEARVKLPVGQGVWPAVWLLGAPTSGKGWPYDGEIDVMENIGSEPGRVHASVHGPGYSGSHPITTVYNLAGGARFTDDYHLFQMDWAENSIQFYVDNQLYQTVTPKNLPEGKDWVFNQPFYLIMNVAVGGGFPQYPDQTTHFPQMMLVDYVRVYKTQ
ncbi:MAG: glycoside hydrolase family 16 protein [Anaerolineae bacterium]